VHAVRCVSDGDGRGSNWAPTVQIAIIADTHLPKGGRGLPATCVRRLRAADLIIHAGDFTQLTVVRELESHAPVIAVHGNVDDEDVQAALPERAVAKTGGASIGVVHDAGPAPGRLARLRRQFPREDAVIFGHSHVPVHEGDSEGFQIFNPGSPTERRRAPSHTMGVLVIRGGQVRFELVVLD